MEACGREVLQAGQRAAPEPHNRVAFGMEAPEKELARNWDRATSAVVQSGSSRGAMSKEVGQRCQDK